MKKLLSVIIALSMCGSLMTFSATTASAATVEAQSVSEAYVSSELETQLDKMSANDTVAVSVNLNTGTMAFDLEEYANQIGKEDQLEYDEEGNAVNCSMELLLEALTYYYDLSSTKADEQYEVVKTKYSQKILSYDRTNANLVCISTKSQVNSMMQSDIASYLELADKTYVDVDTQFTWTEYDKMVDSARKYMSTQADTQYTESNSSVIYSGVLENGYVALNFAEREIDFSAPAVVKRADDVIWVQELFSSNVLLYKDGKIYTAGELYTQGKFTFEEFKVAGGMYFGDVNGDDIVDVNDVTQLQLYLANNTSLGNVLFDFLASIDSVYFDIDADSFVDVKDVTTLQMYLAGYEV